MAKKRFIKSNAGYVMRKKSQVLSAGTIYEQDWLTIGGTDSFVPGQRPIYNSNNFKITNSNVSVPRRKAKYGNWKRNSDNSETWTWSNVSAATMNSVEQKQMILSNNYTSLSDFAYFGSCYELVRASVSDIINFFPGEIYIGDTIHQYVNTSGDIVDFDGYYVENPFSIDISTKTVTSIPTTLSSLHYFYLAYSKYVLIVDNDEDNQIPIDGITITISENPCNMNGTLLSTTIIKAGTYSITIKREYYNGEVYSLSDTPNVRIRPNEEEIENFFDGLDAFEKALLDRQTNYTATFDMPHIDEEHGTYFTKDTFKWPTINGYNLDVESGQYAEYVTRLMEAAEYYDETVSDNIYRSMTHEAIKNMDWSFRREEDEDVAAEYAYGGGKIANVLRVFGRGFDDLKKYVDGIGSLNGVMYNDKNAIPNYFLTDSIDLRGFVTSDVLYDEWFSNDASIGIKTEVLYPGENDGYVAEEVENNFMRRLRLNINHILKHKGTKRSIEMMMGLFGIPRDWYSFKEYVYFADNFIQYNECSLNNKTCIESSTPNAWLIEELNKYNTLNAPSFDNNNEGGYDGLMVREMTVNGNKVLVPYFDKNTTYNGRPYFQSDGGWGKSGNTYLETIKYLSIVDTVDNLKQLVSTAIENGDVYYVNSEYCYYILKNKQYSTNVDVTGYEEGWKRINVVEYKDDLAMIPSEVLERASSQTYYVINDNKFYRLLNLSDHCDIDSGWVEDTNSVIDEDIQQVLYLEGIVDNTEGNNPHVGYGKYDGGQEYLNYYRNIFKGCSDANAFSESLSGSSLSGANINAQGFTLSQYEDNKKCWYYQSDEYGQSKPRTNGFTYEWGTNNTPSTLFEAPDNTPSGTTLPSYPTDGVYVGYLFHVVNGEENAYYRMKTVCYTNNVASDYKWVEVPKPPKTYSGDWNFWNTPTSLNGRTVISGNGNFYPELLINTKKFTMKIEEENVPENYREDFKKYFKDILIPYIKEMIPSTTILEFGSSLSLSSSVIILMDEKPTASFLVDSSKDWQVSGDTGNYIFTPSNGGAGGVKVTVSFNGYGKKVVTFTNGSESASLTVMSIDITSSMDNKEMTFGSVLGSQVVTVNALGGDADYIVSEIPSWCSYEKNGNQLTISTNSLNTSQSDRTGSIVLQHINSSECTTSFDIRQTFSEYAISIEPNVTNVPSNGTTDPLRFTINITGGTQVNDYNIISYPSWCQCMKVGTGRSKATRAASLSGQCFMDLVVSKSTDFSERTGEVIISHTESSTARATLTVTQTSEETTLSVEPTELQFPQSGGTLTLSITSTGGNAGYRIASTTGNWFSTSPNGTNKLNITAQANNLMEGREGSIMIVHSDNSTLYQEVKLTQSQGYAIVVTPESYEFEKGSGSYKFNVELMGATTTAYTINILDADWLSVTEQTENSFTLSVTENGTNYRDTVVNVIHPDSSTVMDSVIVSQLGNYNLTIKHNGEECNGETFTYDVSGGTFEFEVIAEGGDLPDYTVEPLVSGEDWPQITKTSSGLTIKASRNTNASTRESNITITHTNDNTLTRGVILKQDADNYEISVDPTEVKFDYQSQNSTINFTFTGGFNPEYKTLSFVGDNEDVMPMSGWCYVSQLAYNSATVNVGQNTGETRSGIITFEHSEQSGVTCTLRVTQTGLSIDVTPKSIVFDCEGNEAQEADKEIFVSPQAITFPLSGGSSAITVIAIAGSADFDVVSSPEWCETGKTDSSHLSITVAANDTGADRSGEVVVCHKDDSTVKVTISVTSIGVVVVEKSIVANPDKFTFLYTGGTNTSTIIVRGGNNLDFSIVSNPSWCQAEKNGNTQLTLTCDANTGETALTDNVVIAHIEDESVTDTIQVTVQAMDSSDLSISTNPNQLSFDASGGTSAVTVTVNGGFSNDYTIAYKPDWCEVTKESGSELTVQCSANTSSNAREDNIILSHGDNPSVQTEIRVLNVGVEKLGTIIIGGQHGVFLKLEI